MMQYEELNAFALAKSTTIYSELKERILRGVEEAHNARKREAIIDTGDIQYSPGVSSWFIMDLVQRGFKVDPEFKWEPLEDEDNGSDYCILKKLTIKW